MAAKEDPRARATPLREIPRLLAAGAERYNAGAFWSAHEAWEQAWHALRAAGRAEDAAYVQSLVLVTAAFENLRRGKPRGFRSQLAKALRQLRGLRGRGSALGLADEEGFIGALSRVADAAGNSAMGGLDDLGEPPPRLTLAA